MLKYLKNHRVILFVIFIFHAINNFIFAKLDNVPLYFDEAGFYNLSILYHRYLFFWWPKINKIFHNFHSISTFYPPLIFIERTLFYAIFGVSQDVSILANLVFLFVLIYSAFLIGKYINNTETGLLAAFLVSFYPGIYGFSRTNFLAIPVAAAVAFSLYLLLRTENFTNRRFSILFGLAMGCGLLIKWLYLIYIIPPILACFVISFNKYKKSDFTKVFTNFLLAVAMSSAVALPWYLPNIKNLMPQILDASYDNPNWSNFIKYVIKNPFRLNLLQQVILMERYQLFTLYTILFIFFLIKYLVSEDGRIKWIISTSFFIPYLIFNFAIIELYSGELCPRYTINLFILIAVITAKGVMQIKKHIVKKWIIISVISVGITQYYWTWVVYKKTEGNIFNKEIFQMRTTRGALSPKKVDWKIDEIINILRDNRVSNRVDVLVIPHTPLTSALVHNLELFKDNNTVFPMSATFVRAKYGIIPVEEYKNLVKSADFVLTQGEGALLSYDSSAWVLENLKALREQFEQQKGDFSLFKEVKVTMDKEDARILIYRRNGPVVLDSIDLSEPKGEGVLIRAQDFKKGNLVGNPEFGMLIDGGASPAYVVYEATLPYNGKYELWVRYATQQTRPVDIYFDGILKKSNALTYFTKGWKYLDARWFKELEIEAKKGKHSLKLIAEKTLFPHLGSIKMLYKSK